jgi:hypothetical protein
MACHCPMCIRKKYDAGWPEGTLEKSRVVPGYKVVARSVQVGSRRAGRGWQGGWVGGRMGAELMQSGHRVSAGQQRGCTVAAGLQECCRVLTG